MTPELMVPVLIVFIVVGLPVLSYTLLKLARILRNPYPDRNGIDSGSETDDLQIIQDMHRSLERLEKRIDSLETIVLERDRR